LLIVESVSFLNKFGITVLVGVICRRTELDFFSQLCASAMRLAVDSVIVKAISARSFLHYMRKS
jgi:hypothetical protein